jgi:hypothetical protein
MAGIGEDLGAHAIELVQVRRQQQFEQLLATSSTSAAVERRHRRRNRARARAEGRLLVQSLLDPAQGAAQGLRIGTGAAHLEHGFELGSDGIRYGLQRFRCISLRSAALQCVSGTVYQPKYAGFRNWSIVKRILS